MAKPNGKQTETDEDIAAFESIAGEARDLKKRLEQRQSEAPEGSAARRAGWAVSAANAIEEKAAAGVKHLALLPGLIEEAEKKAAAAKAKANESKSE